MRTSAPGICKAPACGTPPRSASAGDGPAHGSPAHGGPTHASPAHGGPARGGPSHASPAHGGPTRGGPSHGSRTRGSPARDRPRAHGRARGFTLIEILVVLVIVAIAAGMVGLSAVAAPDRRLHEDAERLVLAFAVAQSEARSDGRVITWRASASGYRFERPGRRPASTGNAADDAPLPPDDFHDDTALRPRPWSAAPVTITPGGRAGWIVFDTEWMADPLQLTLSAGGRSVIVARDAGGAYAVR